VLRCVVDGLIERETCADVTTLGCTMQSRTQWELINVDMCR
jgi:hypothetical protein